MPRQWLAVGHAPANCWVRSWVRTTCRWVRWCCEIGRADALGNCLTYPLLAKLMFRGYLKRLGAFNTALHLEVFADGFMSTSPSGFVERDQKGTSTGS